MAIDSNYITLQRQIADECGDNQALLSPLSDTVGLLSPIQNAIQSAIAKWERIPFYFNDFRQQPVLASPFQTVSGQEFYSSSDYAPLGTLAGINSLVILISNNRYPLTQRDDNYLNNVSISPSNTGQPCDYTFDAGMLRMYPIPNGAYPMGLTGTQRFTTLSDDTDANAWTQDAFDLIRCEAKLVLGRDVLRNDKITAAATIAIYGDPTNPTDVGYLGALKKETTKRNANRSRIRPTSF